jgi:cytochrome oxidase assembly protein ShyY1
MSRRARSLVVPTLMTFAMLAVLVRLGFWQLERLAWKTRIIKQMEINLRLPPLDFQGEGLNLPKEGDENHQKTIREWIESNSLRKVRFRCDLTQGYRAFVPSAHDDSGYGWNRLTTCWTPIFPGKKIIEWTEKYPDQHPSWLRSFTPVVILEGWSTKKIGQGRDMRAPEIFTNCKKILPSGDVCIVEGTIIPSMMGILAFSDSVEVDWRYPGKIAEFYILPKNRISKLLAPTAFSIENIPNNHLLYAIQWFSFAGILLVIYAIYARRVWREKPLVPSPHRGEG